MLTLPNSGGVVGAEALTDYVKELESGSKKQSAGEIHRLVYCCAFCLPAGASLMLALNNKPLPWFVIKVRPFFIYCSEAHCCMILLHIRHILR